MAFSGSYRFVGSRDEAKRPHGPGSLFFGEQLLYRGDFVHGQMTGNGHRVFMDGSSYSGQFRDGMMHGYGIWTSADGQTVRQGSFHADAFQGDGYVCVCVRAWFGD